MPEGAAAVCPSGSARGGSYIIPRVVVRGTPDTAVAGGARLRQVEYFLTIIIQRTHQLQAMEDDGGRFIWLFPCGRAL
jgi:hypothetical protein